MMESLHIKNFKNFKNLTIEKLGKVNLIVGRNNVGKSSLLERGRGCPSLKNHPKSGWPAAGGP